MQLSAFGHGCVRAVGWSTSVSSGAGPAALLCCVRVRGGAPPISLASAVKKFQTVVPCGRLCAQRPTSTHTGGRFLPSTTGVGSSSRANLRCATERRGAERIGTGGPRCARTCCGGAQLRPACAAVLPDANARTFHRQRVGATCAAVACLHDRWPSHAMRSVGWRLQAACRLRTISSPSTQTAANASANLQCTNALVAHRTPPWVRA